MEAYSVLMTVYCEENAPYFEQSVRSMLNQTVAPEDFVIVCDGPLSNELNQIILSLQQEYPALFQVCRLEKNVGIGAAANAGLKLCKNDLVARMDSDDISIPDRCEKQLKRFSENKNLAVLGGYIEEFSKDPSQAFAVRVVPETNEGIRAFAKRRQPFNNVTVMLRRSAVLDVGGYNSLRRAEDFDLYIRLLHDNYYAENIPEVLVKVRVDSDAHKRRSSVATLAGCVVSRWRSYRLGYSSFIDFVYCSIGGLAVFVCPGIIQRWLYSKLLRSKPSKKQQLVGAVLEE